MARRFGKASRMENALVSHSQVYTDINQVRPSEYSDYESYEPEWGALDGYFVSCLIGQGRYGEVYEGFNKFHQLCIIKLLKPVKLKKIRREIKILQNLQGGPNIVGLIDVVKEPVSQTPVLIMEHLTNFDHRFLYPRLTDWDLRYYMYQLLKALDYSHSQGVMHRDVKPHNIVIDHDRRELRLIDWGLAEFYFPGKQYNVRVASRHFKGPELLVDLMDYDYALDLWGVGCILASVVFRREPFFNGMDNVDQLVKISKVLGTDELYAYLEKYGISLDSEFKKVLGKRKRRPWSKFISDRNQEIATDDAIDLIDKLLRYDHQERLTGKQAMQHSFFDPVRSFEESNLIE